MGRRSERAGSQGADNTLNGLLKLLWPDPELEVSTGDLAWAAELALEMRRRVKEQQAAIGQTEFGRIDLSYSVDGGSEKVVHCAESLGAPRAGRPQGERDAASKSTELPEPDPVEVRESVGARAAEYGVGDQIDGRFEILEMLGQGGFSKVYRVRDEVEGEERALKLFESAAGYDAVRRELGALRKVQHPRVVQVFWASKTADGHWYLITEYIDGVSLDEYTTGERRLRDREAVDVALDVLDALVAIHPNTARLEALEGKRAEAGELSEPEFAEWQGLQDRGLIHRDIKPHNIMLTRVGAKLLDFNIASRVGDPINTQSGTPPYQPPDADFGTWDVSTDVFAVGVVLYELLCDGAHPYPRSQPVADREPTDPKTVRPDLDHDLAKWLSKSCAPERAARFATAVEMRGRLLEIRATM